MPNLDYRVETNFTIGNKFYYREKNLFSSGQNNNANLVGNFVSHENLKFTKFSRKCYRIAPTPAIPPPPASLEILVVTDGLVVWFVIDSMRDNLGCYCYMV